MMTAAMMAVADTIIHWFCSGEWTGAEFSESYVRDIVLEHDDDPAFEGAVNYLCEVKLLAPTVVNRKGAWVPGLRVL